jgi:hypothetical protein
MQNRVNVNDLHLFIHCSGGIKEANRQFFFFRNPVGEEKKSRGEK